MCMAVINEHAVGLRELRHSTSEVIARVRQGEIIDVTEYGRPIARIVPIQDREPLPIVESLVRAGRMQLASRPGYRPIMRTTDRPDVLGNALADLRDEEVW